MNKSFADQLIYVFIHNNVHEALGDLKWKIAMEEHMKSLRKKCRWDIVELLAMKNRVGCK